MKKIIFLAFILLSSVAVMAGDKYAESKIESIGLFKNGLAYVRRTLTVNSPGEYIIKDLPEPVYGTFYVESDGDVIARSTMMDVEEELKSFSSMEDLFKGQKVTIHLKSDGDLKQQTGIFLSRNVEQNNDWNRNYGPNSHLNYYPYRNKQTHYNSANNNTICLKTDSGISFIEKSMIATITAENGNNIVKRKKPVLIVEVKTLPKRSGNTTVKINYLTKGMSWAASYAVDLSNDKELKITQKGVIKNELIDFADVEIELISGFPSIKFSDVTSPLSLKTNWSTFFSQLNNMSGNNSRANVMSQMAVSTNIAAPANIGASQAASNLNEGTGSVDIYYHSVGELSMKNGDSIALNVKTGKAKYDKVILWDIPDTRDEYGRQIDYYQMSKDPKYKNEIWDSVRFNNPFEFPMTTGAVTLLRNNNFLGESISYWVNPGQETILQANKALSLEGNIIENEVGGKRKEVYVLGTRHFEVIVEGSMTIKNYRNTSTKTIIKRRFSGNLLEADLTPESRQLESGIYAINKRCELTWEFDLAAGEEKVIKYKYTIFTR